MLLAIYGAGGLGSEIYDLAFQINLTNKKWDLIFFVDDNYENGFINSIPRVKFESLNSFLDERGLKQKDVKFSIAVGEPKSRFILEEKIKRSGYSLQLLIHPFSNVSQSAKIEAGAIISYGCYISSNSNIGSNVLIMPLASVGHDAKIDNCSIISSYVSLGGHVQIGYQSFIGMGVQVIQGSKIGSKSIISIGSVVTRNIEDNIIAMGNPARPIRQNIEEKVFK